MLCVHHLLIVASKDCIKRHRDCRDPTFLAPDLCQPIVGCQQGHATPARGGKATYNMLLLKDWNQRQRRLAVTSAFMVSVQAPSTRWTGSTKMIERPLLSSYLALHVVSFSLLSPNSGLRPCSSQDGWTHAKLSSACSSYWLLNSSKPAHAPSSCVLRCLKYIWGKALNPWSVRGDISSSRGFIQSLARLLLQYATSRKLRMRLLEMNKVKRMCMCQLSGFICLSTLQADSRGKNSICMAHSELPALLFTAPRECHYNCIAEGRGPLIITYKMRARNLEKLKRDMPSFPTELPAFRKVYWFSYNKSLS